MKSDRLNRKAALLISAHRHMRAQRQDEMAEHLGIAQSMLSRLERGSGPIKLDLYAAAAEFLGFDPCALFDPNHWTEDFLDED